ncbi:alginate export family protein [Geomonas edaphica]|uniref:porin n=1 Tax=Geomonas edaphica TaxID=2570226 RepID=UPI0010A77FC6|nr:porin [Geomonas edaphica]
MKNKKLVVAVAAALTAASAVPALALENQFTGSFTAFFDTGNFAGTGVLIDDSPTSNYFVQRLRLGYTAKADDHVKLVTKFEFDYNFWGNSSYENARGGGGALGADTVNMETKHIYLDLNYPTINAKIGMQPVSDAFKGIVFDADMAGIVLSHEYSKATVTAGYSRFHDSADGKEVKTDVNALGSKAFDMYLLDGKYTISKDLTVGAAYYYINDNHTPGKYTVYPEAKVHTLGLNAAGVVGPLSLDGFAVKQFGDLTTGRDAKGYAFNVGAKMALAGGTARSEFLYVSGGKNAFYVPASDNGYTEGGQFYNSEMIMLGRDKWATTIDNAIIYDVNNNEEGVIMGTIGYDYNFTDKITAAANAGFAAVAKDLNNTDSKYLGTELNAEAYYKLTANVTLGARGGYVILGDHAKGIAIGGDSDNLWDMKLIANYSF